MLCVYVFVAGPALPCSERNVGFQSLSYVFFCYLVSPERYLVHYCIIWRMIVKYILFNKDKNIYNIVLYEHCTLHENQRSFYSMILIKGTEDAPLFIKF